MGDTPRADGRSVTLRPGHVRCRPAATWPTPHSFSAPCQTMSQSVRTCSQCTATTAAGTRCRKRTCRGPVCWQHAQSQHGLRVKPSQIQNAGFGLFATKRMAKDARIAAYDGEHRTRADVKEEYGDETGQYVLCRSDRECFDASASNSSLARFANDARGSSFTNNARFTRGAKGPPLLRAARAIPAGREVLVSYGREYWR